MDINRTRAAAPRPTGQVPLSPSTAVLMAIACGLCAGYLDVAIIVFKKFCWNPEGYYRIARDFPWSVPVGHAVLMAIVGMAVAAACLVRPGIVSTRAGLWLFATLAIWGALLRMPLYAVGSLLLAAGTGRLIVDAVAARGGPDSRRVRHVLLALVGVLGVLAAASSGREAFGENRAVGRLPSRTGRPRNVVLIVWDTVRSYSLGLYGYGRETSPNLARCAARGIEYNYAMAPAPWTYPSHSCFFTGQWPMRINTQWKMTLDTAYPTLAEYLASRGYQTAGFVANTNCCTYESGLGRGFLHFEDYSMAPLSLAMRTIPGQWIVSRILRLSGRYHEEKWAGLQSRDARAINDAFLDWLGRRRADRPFFAFLNYFDAHEPYVPPPGFAGRFGNRLRPRDYQFLLDFSAIDKSKSPKRDIVMARDCYDACIAYLDEQLGRLLGELGRRGLLAETDVIITSDHGEAFGDHGHVGHSYSVTLDEICVPLVIHSPDVPPARVWSPVSLRDLPATVVDRLGLAEDSPFPGRSLAAYWRSSRGQGPEAITTPAFSEQASRTGALPQPGPGGVFPGFQMSIVAGDHHYIRNGVGRERLYDLAKDPFETVDLLKDADRRHEVDAYRRMLLEVLTENPGSAEVEQAYLASYREALRALVGEAPARGVAARPGTDDDRAGRPRGGAS